MEIHELQGSSFFEQCIKYKIDFENAKKTEERFSVFEIIASELVTLNCLY